MRYYHWIQLVGVFNSAVNAIKTIVENFDDVIKSKNSSQSFFFCFGSSVDSSVMCILEELNRDRISIRA